MRRPDLGIDRARFATLNLSSLLMLAVYLTIWIALTLFAAGEVGRGHAPQRTGWPWLASAVGLVLSLLHTALSFGVVHGWSHAAAVRHTEAQTQSVFGLAAGWGIYANYLFFAVWAGDLAWWYRDGGVADRARWIVTLVRSLYLIIIVNAAIIFAAPSRRLAGVAAVICLVAAWQPRTWHVARRT